MGYYINPPDMTNEQWLNREGFRHGARPKAIASRELLVCLVDNGPFKAAGIAYCEPEIEAFDLPDDHRRKVWYSVDKRKLISICPALEAALEDADRINEDWRRHRADQKNL